MEGSASDLDPLVVAIDGPSLSCSTLDGRDNGQRKANQVETVSEPLSSSGFKQSCRKGEWWYRGDNYFRHRLLTLRPRPLPRRCISIEGVWDGQPK